MDDDVRMVGTLLAKPEPPAEAADRSRNRLQQVMLGGSRHPARWRGARWLAGGLGLAVAGTAAVTVIASAPPARPTHHRPAMELASGQQILLAAAHTAESQGAATGAYWHTKLTLPADPRTGVSSTTEKWIRPRDGRIWISVEPGLVSPLPGRYTLRGTHLGFAAVRSLPTEPDALKTKLLGSRDAAPAGKGRSSLVVLLNDVLNSPAPPPVRAAAFRVLASLPGIRKLGEIDGDVILSLGGNRISAGEGGTILVVDSATAQTRIQAHQVVYQLVNGKRQALSNAVESAGWTDTLPGRLVPFEVQQPRQSRPARH